MGLVRCWALSLVCCANLLDLPDDPRLAEPVVAEPHDQDEPSQPAQQGGAGSDLGAAPTASPSETTPVVQPPSNATDPPQVSTTSPDGEISDAGSGLDAAFDATSATPTDAEPPCAGVRLFGICWYLGALGSSCDQTCASHGGYDERASSHVGTTAQGGSALECNSILSALQATTPALERSRTDGAGVGCHLFGSGRDPYWLESPSFAPSSSLALARVVCGCNE